MADILLDWPARSELVYRVARRIVNRHLGENDYRMHHNGEVRALRRLLPDAKVIFDVGANVGQWASAARLLAPNAEIHCFEPDKTAFRRLSKAVPDAILNNVGVGAEPGSLPFHVFGDGAEVNSLYPRAGHGLSPIRIEAVPIIALDDYARDLPHIDFIKIDTDGHERAVFEGAKRIIDERRASMIQFEYSWNYTETRTLLRDIFEMLEGYRLFKILPHGLRPVTYHYQLENYSVANYIAMRRELA